MPVILILLHVRTLFNFRWRGSLLLLEGTPLVHLADELVDVRLPVTKVTALDEVLELPCSPATSGVGELEGPQKVGSLLTFIRFADT